MMWLRLRIRATERRFMTPQMIAVILKDHAKGILSIIAWMPKEIPIARLRFLLNHWERMGVQGTKMKPNPMPMRTPWER